MLTTGIDKLIFQNITDNKVIQYGLTAASAVAGQLLVVSMFNDDKLSKHFVFKTYEDDGENLINKLSLIGQALAVKYIWDSNTETLEDMQSHNELDGMQEQIEASAV
jgi:hypothetical protein